MKPLYLLLLMTAFVSVAYAACRQVTVIRNDGTMQTCQVCCNAAGCTTTCF